MPQLVGTILDGFQADEDLGFEFSPTHRPPAEAERSLWFAVLWNAISDVRSANPEIRAEAIRWLFHDKSSDVGSLSWVCEHLFISKGWLKRTLEKVYKKNAKRFHPIPFTRPKIGYQHCTKDYLAGMVRDRAKKAAAAASSKDYVLGMIRDRQKKAKKA